MMRYQERKAILAMAVNCDDSVVETHFRMFVSAFVAKNRQDRWIYLLLHHSKISHRNSSKLEAHLDHSICLQINEKTVREQFELSLTGVYYDFSDIYGKLSICLGDALILGEAENAIFSVHRGKLGFYFSHESRIWLCQRKH